jgi:hypothetical protein
MRTRTKIILGVLSLPVLLVGFVGARAWRDTGAKYPDVTIDAALVPKFTEVELPFAHRHDGRSLPMSGAAVIDLDGDGVHEVFLGGGREQQDGLFRFEGGKFVALDGAGLAKEAGDSTLGAAVIDADGDGRSDLFVARDSGVYLYTNKGGQLSGSRLAIALDEKSVAISLALTDLDRDGKVDMFAAAYLKKDKMEGQNIFNKEGYGASSVLLRNNGDNTFRDITAAAGMTYVQNTFQGLFTDLDDDGDPDLVVAHDTGQVRTWKNNGDLTFTNAPNPTSAQYGYPMGIAAADYDGDGRTDLFFSNVGTTVPDFLGKGDLRDDQVYNKRWILLRNDGGFNFTDVAEEAKIAGYEFSWGAVFEDFNLDGHQDLLVAENYIGFPPHKLVRLPGRLLMQRPDHTFAAAEAVAGVQNAYYEISPLVADFDNNGCPDLVRVNLNGPARAFLNGGIGNNFVKVRVPDRPSSLDAKVVVETASGKRYTARVLQGEGLLTDQSHDVIVGTGAEKEIRRVEVTFPSGKVATVDAPAAGALLKVEEPV